MAKFENKSKQIKLISIKLVTDTSNLKIIISSDWRAQYFVYKLVVRVYFTEREKS